jgi:glycosyltransferase involved in cell wall biosynthesis
MNFKIIFLFSGDLWAGAEVLIYNLLKGLKHYENLDIVAISLNKGTLTDRIAQLGVNTIIVDESKYSFIRIFFKLLATLKVTKAHLIHSHRYKENLLAFILSRFLNRPALVSTLHGLPEKHTEKTSLKTRVAGIINKLILKKYFDKTVVVSREMAIFIEREWGFAPKRIAIIHNGLSLNTFPPKERENDLITIGSAGRFFPVKDYSLMVEVAYELIKKYKCKVRFVLAGDGPLAHTLEQMIKERGLNDCFALPGFLEDLDNFYQSLSIYLNTSLHEGIPMSILEAMAYGLPVIAPKVGGIPEMIDDGISGFLIDSRNPLDFAEKCLKLIHDKNLRLKMGADARKKIEDKFSFQNMAKSYYKMYKELILC